MRAKADGGQATIAVCLVEYNPLAARHLERILQTDSTIRILHPDQILNSSRARKSQVAAFLVDRGTLPMPLSKYLRFLRLRVREARTLILDNPQPDEELCRLLFFGIQGFLSYDHVDEQLPAAVRAVADGHLWVARDVLEQYARYAARLTRLKDLRGEPLTPQEQRIVELVQRRLSNKEISSILRISEGTVKFHLSNIFGKLGVSDRHGVMELATPGRAPAAFPQK